MEQKSKKNGLPNLDNLDPMRFFKYVMAKRRDIPCVMIYNHRPEKLYIWAKEHPQVKFVMESDELPGGIDVFMPNVTYSWLNNLTYDDWLRRWQWTDYVLCDEKDKEYWVQAQLCGVQPLFGDESLEIILKGIRPLDSNQRVDNWELARSILT